MRTLSSVCPHDCPSACPVDVDVLDDGRIGRLHGGKMPYTEGVICAKVARYGERVHHPDRITTPLRRIGDKGAGRFAPISWDEALDEITHRFQSAASKDGAQAVWPYFYAGTMGLVQMGATNRLRRAMGYSGQSKTICSSIAGAGWMAGVGAKWGIDPREMVQSDLIVIWGANPAATQVHLMGLMAQARKTRGAKLVVIDPYRTPTAEKADLHLMLRPGSDAALACAVMHVLFRDGLTDADYLARYGDGTDALRAHVASRTPAWAAAITGLTTTAIEDFARLYGATKRSLIRLGYGMSRSRNGAVNLHAASCLPVLTGAWAHAGGGATQSLSGSFALDRSLMDALDIPEPPVRQLDMSRIGAILTGEADALRHGPPVTAMLIQGCNPATVAPETAKVRRGLAGDDLFVAVHEQVMTQTARFADLVLPATTFVEHADLYTAYGHTFLQVAKPVIAPIGESRSNHWLVSQLAHRLGVSHPSFSMDEWTLIEACLRASNLPDAETLHARRWLDCALPFAQAHFIDGFGHGGKFRFAPDWSAIGPDHAGLPALPDHLDIVENADAVHPFRLITPPSRHFLNTSFTETATSRRLAGRPTALIHTADAARLGIADGDCIVLGNRRGGVSVHAHPTDGIAIGVVAVEGIWPDEAFIGGIGINTLIGADPVPPNGGAAFHDCAVWIKNTASGESA
ncbi:molybdopterin oxidoreductase family protein [Magnetospirillum sulfuroxidans]|uniref:Molybdopterin oxidoreductase family protein n=1 Tax=Magnetospirillum sulfuroxidans TaxID=611300 RepID=A0ABS5IEH9_9PROT|nr:molybdopterin oxidoreductase family protein [Magnetospirillum sulfuroxidans]MBR9972827.1 molybdopterin oxidoreductase family protein [Magnetospirillum sulfuroxidans]